MNAYLIKASAPSPFKEYKKYLGGPPQNLFSTAACTPSEVAISMTDETIDQKVDFASDAEVVAIFMSTPDALRAYEIADTFRSKGKTVVLGGLHTKAMPEEALQHADAVLLGETEGIWEELLEDVANGTLKKEYQRTVPVDLATVTPYPTNMLTPKDYDGSWTVLVGRGCPFTCAYCTIPGFLGKLRNRPVGQVIDEIKASGVKWVELHSDNLMANRDYAMELLSALEPLNIWWSGETNLNFVEDDELFELAARSGLKYLLVGLETLSHKALRSVGKGFQDPKHAKRWIAKLHERNIFVDSAFLFGFDQHTPEIFHDTADFVHDINIDVAHSVIVTPYPGTRLYQTLEKSDRILTKDWSKYDGANAVFEPANMTAQQLEEGAYTFWQLTQKRTEQNIHRFYWSLWY